MKTVVLLPKTDTTILCLPEKWVGVPLICKIKPMKTSFANSEEVEIELERLNVFHKHKRKTKNS